MSYRKRPATYSDQEGDGDSRPRGGGTSTFVTIGTEQPADASDIRARDRNKYLPVHLQEVRDEKGRKRLHGAFTGGFSAGYFNTVGSKEGWTPSQFVSSRSSRSVQHVARPEDFMDEEDLAEHAGQIEATEDFDILGGTEREVARKGAALKAVADESATTGGLPGRLVEDLIGPAKDPVGIKLLRKMGWREGHGVGPRAKRKRKMQEEEDVHAAEHLFAPKDISVTAITPKTDTYGLGYDPFRNAPEFAASRPLSGSDSTYEKPAKKPRRGLGKGGFGVGIFENEEEEEDVYGAGMASYDMIIDDDAPMLLGRISKTKPAYGSAHKTSTAESYLELNVQICHDGRTPLVGFILSNIPMPEPKWYPPPTLPPDFVPTHSFDDARAQQPQSTSTQRTQLTADQRRDMLGEAALNAPQRSVFSFLPIKEHARLQDFVEKAQKAREALAPAEPKPSAAKAQEPTVEKETALSALRGFMPFGNDLPKQQRYRRFLEVKAGLASEFAPTPKHQTVRDAAHEVLEFAKAAQIFKPLSSMMASRFTSASSTVDGTNVTSAPRDEVTSAAELNMFGRLTRTRTDWKPDKLLCKRFNVADPWLSKAKKQDPVEEEGKAREKEVLNERTMRDLLFERDRLVAEGRLSGEGESGTPLPPEKLIAGTSTDVGAAEGGSATEQGQKVEEEYERPPMDIFKAIFADSDSDEDSEEEVEEETKIAELKELEQTANSLRDPAPMTVPEESVPSATNMPRESTTTASLPPPTFRPLFRKKEERRKPAKEKAQVEGESILNVKTSETSEKEPQRSGREGEEVHRESMTHTEQGESKPPRDKKEKSAKKKDKKRGKKRKEIVSFEEEEEEVVWKEKVINVPQAEEISMGLQTQNSASTAPRRRVRPAAADFI